ncbi:formylmethanofuran dehydrogenase subunit C [Planctomicrobium piriforme]|uniref:Formylmethanofuran dehydrogenase subunit C n=1 Tax=Planctomicrobium piriforme TaxID=1576369 RepID=A0A1I3F596_9PLAN|nr:formylmethanofuran dehydrogenase subunit C [Planctomicrobium piriforme]SFI06388.1 formylmethanofuran dehydrogenase subunit C [Planctomicrobium piriforme]
MPLTFHPQFEFTLPLDAAGLRPDARCTREDVARLQLVYGNERVACGDLFALSGDAAEDRSFVIAGDLRKVSSLGAGMTAGSVQVQGNAGSQLGAKMTGGVIAVTGNAGNAAGSQMRGGRIAIQGDAGHQLGGCPPGFKKGMTGGQIVVHGSAGTEAGCRMRRGLIAIGKNAGEAAGYGMIAGTICVFGQAAARLGAGMKRGTLFVGGNDVRESLPCTFRLSAAVRPVFLQLLLRELRSNGLAIPDAWFSTVYNCYRGDLLELGLGEVFSPAGLERN